MGIPSVRYVCFFLMLFIGVHIFPRAAVYAQLTEWGVATTHIITDKATEDGDIVSLSDKKDILSLSTTSYDEKMFGVVVKDPIMVVRVAGKETPVVRSGEVNVNVTTLNGDIIIGDYITTSEIPGKGQKSTDATGYVLGIALEQFSEKNGTKIDALGKKVSAGKIRVSVGIGPATPFLQKVTGGFIGGLQHAASVFIYTVSTSKQLEKIFRYILAIIVAITAIGISFRSFGRNVTKGIESIGRNPLAKGSIQSMIVINVVLIAIVSIGGIVLSLIIISL